MKTQKEKLLKAVKMVSGKLTEDRLRLNGESLDIWFSVAEVKQIKEALGEEVPVFQLSPNWRG